MNQFPNQLTENIYIALQQSTNLRRAVILELENIERTGSPYPEVDLGYEIQNHITDAFATFETTAISADMRCLVTNIFAFAVRTADFDAIATAFLDRARPEF